MTKRALKGLKGSIKKWEGIVAGTETDKGPLNCPLCKLYISNVCRSCPVMQNTKEKGCLGTPYDKYDDTPTKKVAKKELYYLKSLLAKGEAT